MPTYVYKFVETGETIEVQQSFSDETLTEYAHPESGDLLSVKKVFQPVGVTFKGSGFFKTDNRGAKSVTTPSGGSSSESGSGTTSDSNSSNSSNSSSDSGSSKDSSSSSSDSKPASTSSDTKKAAPAAPKPKASSSSSSD